MAIESKGFGSEGQEMKGGRATCIVLLALLGAISSAAAENSAHEKMMQEPLNTQSEMGFNVDPNLINDLHPIVNYLRFDNQ